MPLENYGVWVGRPIEKKAGYGKSNHFHLRVDDGNRDYRVTINIKSQSSPSELLFLVDENFIHPVTEGLERFSQGFHSLKTEPGGHALDFIRGNLFQPNKMIALPKGVPGPDNDLNEKIGYFVDKAIRDKRALIYAFGEPWGPDQNKKDRYFNFSPGNGVHNIHMNQGNVARFVKDDGVWQDGAVLIYFPAARRWVALFLAFQSQSWHTDDRSGRRKTKVSAKQVLVPEKDVVLTKVSAEREASSTKETDIPKKVEPPIVTVEKPIEAITTRDGLIRIIAAQVNLPGRDTGRESVTLINTSPDSLELNGWAIADKHKRKEKIGLLKLAPGETTMIRLSGKSTQLTNKGGIITLLDENGLKIDGVAYDKEAGKKQGWSLVF